MEQKEEYEHRFKLFMLGDEGVGKTSYLAQYTDAPFPSTYQATIGINFYLKITTIAAQKVKLHLWDTAGATRFIEVIHRCLNQDVHGILLCFDLTNPVSFKHVQEYTKIIPSQIPCILVGCKSDLQRTIDLDKVWELARKLKAPYVECSAIKGININNVIEELLRPRLFLGALNKIIPHLKQEFEAYAKTLYSRVNSSSLFSSKPSGQELELYYEYQASLQAFLHAKEESELIEFYTDTLNLIGEINNLYAQEYAVWSVLGKSPFAQLLEQALTRLQLTFPHLKHLKTSNDADLIHPIKSDCVSQ